MRGEREGELINPSRGFEEENKDFFGLISLKLGYPQIMLKDPKMIAEQFDFGDFLPKIL